MAGPAREPAVGVGVGDFLEALRGGGLVRRRGHRHLPSKARPTPRLDQVAKLGNL
jgi:hypothetical protein